MANFFSNTTGLQYILDALESKALPTIHTSTCEAFPSAVDQTIRPVEGFYFSEVRVPGDANLIADNIKSGVTIFGVEGALTGGDSAGLEPAFTSSISEISGAMYGFTLNNSGYYESQNKGVNYSYAICRVNLNVKAVSDIVFDVINYAESNYDYAIFGALDTALGLNDQTDSNAKENFRGRQSASVVNVTYNSVPTGTHYIDIKFVKDQSQHSNNDSVQFKIQPADMVMSEEMIEQLIAAEPDLVSNNIKSGVNIFGVTGTYTGSTGGTGGSSSNIYQSIYNRTISGSFNDSTATQVYPGAFCNCSKLTSVIFPSCSSVGMMAFTSCTSLKTASFPKCTKIGSSAFESCSYLSSAYFPELSTISSRAFSGCSRLTSISFPKLSRVSYMGMAGVGASSIYLPKLGYIDMYAFRNCTSLGVLSLPVASYISTYAFENCRKLSKLYLNSTKVCSLTQSSAFDSTPFKGYSTYFSGTPYIYVPGSLVSSYKAASYWSYFSKYFSAI